MLGRQSPHSLWSRGRSSTLPPQYNDEGMETLKQQEWVLSHFSGGKRKSFISTYLWTDLTAFNILKKMERYFTPLHLLWAWRVWSGHGLTESNLAEAVCLLTYPLSHVHITLEAWAFMPSARQLICLPSLIKCLPGAYTTHWADGG